MFWSIVIDVALVAVLVLFIVSYTRNGFVGTLIKLGQNWLSLLVSFVISPLVSGLLQDLFLFRWISNGIQGTLTTIIETNPNGYNLSELFSNLPAGFVGLLNHFNISLPALEAEFGSATTASESILAEIANRIAAPCSSAIASILAYIICFILTKLAIKWLDWKLRQRRSSFFRKVDGVMGFIMGTVIGLCAVFGITWVTYTVFQLIIVFDASNPIFTVYENSYVFKFIKEFDFIGLFKNIYLMIKSKF